MAAALMRHTPILDEPPEDRQVALTKRLPSLSNYLATDVSSWAWHMTIVRDNELWRETDAVSWEDYCTRVVGKPLDWCGWIIGGYEALRNVRQGPIAEDDALLAGKVAAAIMAKMEPIGDHGGSRRSEKVLGQVDNINLKNGDSSKGGTSASYLAARIKRDNPEIAAAVERGEYKSMRQAAIDAGIVKLPDPIRSAKRLWEKMTMKDRSEFEAFISDWRKKHGY